MCTQKNLEFFYPTNTEFTLENEAKIQTANPDDVMVSIRIFGTPDDFDFKLGKGKKKK